MVICLERDVDLHMVQLMPLPLTVPCFSKIQIGFTFLVPAHPVKMAVKRVCVCVYVILPLVNVCVNFSSCVIGRDQLKDRLPSKELRERLGIDDIALVLQQNRL